MSNKNPRKGADTDNAAEEDATGQAMTPATAGTAITGDGSGNGAALPPVPPVPPEAAAPAPADHQWNDEYVGVGGSYVVIDGKRVPADQA